MKCLDDIQLHNMSGMQNINSGKLSINWKIKVIHMVSSMFSINYL